MNKFIVRLKCDANPDIKRYFEKRGVIITFFDGILKDTLIIETELTRDQVNDLMYVDEAKEPRIGRFNDEYMRIQ